MSETYKILRFYQREGKPSETIKRGLTLAEAQEHCSDPETSSATCTKDRGQNRTRVHGEWFDGYTKE